jgi:hypothetical protein
MIFFINDIVLVLSGHKIKQSLSLTVPSFTCYGFSTQKSEYKGLPSNSYPVAWQHKYKKISEEDVCPYSVSEV